MQTLDLNSNIALLLTVTMMDIISAADFYFVPEALQLQVMHVITYKDITIATHMHQKGSVGFIIKAIPVDSDIIV